jgi:hypothetical protein
VLALLYVTAAKAAEDTENVKPLAAKSLLLMLAIIAVVIFAVVLGGLGYFSPGSDKD